MHMPRSGWVLFFVAALAVRAQAADDKAALQGMKEGKIVYDITEGDGKALLVRQRQGRHADT